MAAQQRHWGHLPASHGSQGPRDDEYDECTHTYPTHEHRRSLDAQPPRWSRSNRASVNTDALTESTFSPHSPTASSFVGAAQGLAPRPPSYQRQDFVANGALGVGVGMVAGADTVGNDVNITVADATIPQEPVLHMSEETFCRPHRQSSEQYREPSFESAPRSPQPSLTAPEYPRRPPVSHHQPYATSEPSYIRFKSNPDQVLPTSLQPQPLSSGWFARVDDGMEPEGHYTTRGEEHPDDPRYHIHDVTGGRSVVAPSMAPRDVAAGGSRRPSVTVPSERRKKFANDHSPLQRLELTLDSMTKEEKRARVQAAEQRARERAAKRAADASTAQSTESHARRIPIDTPSDSPEATAPNVTASKLQMDPAETGARGQPYPQHQLLVARGHRSETGDLNRAVGPPPPTHVPKQQEDGEPRAGLSRQNLSFSERASRNEKDHTAEQTSPVRQTTAFFSGGVSSGMNVTRNGSNRLRKDPPADQWTSFRPKHLQGLQRRATEPIYGEECRPDEAYVLHAGRGNANISTMQNLGPEYQDPDVAGKRPERQDKDHSVESLPERRVSNMVFKDPENLRPGEGLYQPPVWLNEYQNATVGFLGGTLLDLAEVHEALGDKNKAWWENTGGRKNNAYSSRPRKAEAFDGEYDDTNAPTRFKPPLYLKCGPLLRYCGIRQEKVPPRSQNSAVSDREIWRGSVMIVTQDSESSYDIAPMLRLFVQEIQLLPPPPLQVNGDLPPEYVDPIAGHPKLGRRGETLYVRPVEHLEEARDLSYMETDEGLYEKTRSPPDMPPPNCAIELPQSFAGRQKRIQNDGEKLQKYKDVRGFRLHAERGCTFWRFNIEVELREKQQRIAYRINRGPCMAFWVPSRGQAMNIMFHSCNGFSASVNPDDLSGPDPMWRDVLNTHQSQPFHVMIGGGDQIYNDSIAHECSLLREWLEIRHPQQKHGAAFTASMQDEMEEFYLQRYCVWFSQGLFGLAASQIPMVNMYDDHDIFDGYGSYPDNYMRSPVFAGLGAVAFKYYMLFQHQSVLTETENTEPSWILGQEPGPYIKELSRSVYVSMGGKAALLAVDCRTERTEYDVVNSQTWEKIINRMYAEVRRGHVEHLLVLLGVPIAYPRMVWLENILTSRLMDPVKALGRTGMFGKVLNNIDGGVEVLDDLNNHWTAKNHKHERSIIMEDLQDLAIDKSLRITILSGDVHLAAVGQFYSNSKLGLPKHKDPRYMINVVSSAIANAPPSDLLADLLNKRNKVHHFDRQTEEGMAPLFHHGVDGKPRNNKHLLPHRNWCSIRPWSPGRTPPPTPPLSSYDRSPSPPNSNGGGGLFRRLSLGSRTRSVSNRLDGSRTSVRGDRPPVSGGVSGLFRSLSRRNSTDGPRPIKLTRTMSLGSGESKKKGLFSHGRRGSKRRPDDGGINGQWGGESEDGDGYFVDSHPSHAVQPSGLRGGGTYEHSEFSDEDELHFTAELPQHSRTVGGQPAETTRRDDGSDAMMRPFHRTPTGLSVKQMRKAEKFIVDLEGGLDICLNVEVNPKDPTGITVPYRLLVPRLQYEYNPADDELQQPTEELRQPTGLKRFLSLRKRPERPKLQQQDEEDGGGSEGKDNDDDVSDESSDVPPRR
ncbi:uncharacterized protein MAM_06061 [Metarhizium album ARSEF 1941]|uniref:PhoD-like phosphatase domain-containing protein n=1 Tax=Metarhizium album (strain ARSEF 1941) TaxID=1081103 RepID=A0A0B2WIT2_METAS|nr:uncharacterized protein MAM_06061 [Metarhizium album ARSEF 1941]KHN95956.1 hypothetical protein MAM_06061 [Metarhizium album ARSEF 1941]